MSPIWFQESQFGDQIEIQPAFLKVTDPVSKTLPQYGMFHQIKPSSCSFLPFVYLLPLFLMHHSGRAEPPRDLMSARQPLGELSMNVDEFHAPGNIHHGGIENRSLQTETLVPQVAPHLFIQIIFLVIHFHFLAGWHVLDCVMYITCRS